MAGSSSSRPPAAMDPATSFGSSTWRAALPDTLVDHDSSLEFMTPDAVVDRPVSEDKAEHYPADEQQWQRPQRFMTDAELEKKRQQQSVMRGAQMLPEKSQQAMCGVTEEAFEVMVYKILTRLASNGRMAADCSNGPQHISDVNSDVAESSKPVEQFGDVPGEKRQIGDSHTAEADVSDRHTAEKDVGGEDRQSAEIDVFLDQEDVLDDIIPRMKRNEAKLVPRQRRGHKK